MSISNTKVIDRGYKRIMEQIKKLKGNTFIEIGVHERAGTYPEGKPTVAQVAFWNEYGTRIVPSRPFLRKTMSEKFERFKAYTKELHQQVLSLVIGEEAALNKIGFLIASSIQNSIKTAFQWATPLSERSISGKQRSSESKQKKEGKNINQKILIKSGLLLRSIGWRTVVSGKETHYEVNPKKE